MGRADSNVFTPMLLATLVLTGCFGGGGSAGETDPSSTGAGPPGTGGGTIQGLVLTEEHLPVPGADVAILQLDQVARTDDGGAFSFSDVPPGSHALHVQRLGYEAGSALVKVQDGGIAEVTITLAAIDVAEPRYASDEKTGRIYCSYYAAVSWSSCPYATTVGPHDNCVEFEIDRATSWRQAELVWLQNNELSPERLWMGELNSDGNAWLDTGQGGSPLVIATDKELKVKKDAADSVWCVFIASATTPNLAFDQEFTVYFTAFYDMEIPEGFAARPA